MIKIDYDTKLGHIEEKDGSINLLINGPSNKVARIPLTQKRIPSNGLFLGEQLVNDNLKIERALELGAGKYAPASFCLLVNNRNIIVDAIEIQSEEYSYLQKIIALNNLEDRFNIYQGNMFDALGNDLKNYNLIYSNIAQLPLEPGEMSSLHDHGGSDGWQFLDNIIKQSPKFLNSKGYLALMIFDFLGIEKRNNTSIPSLLERLQNKNFSVVRKEAYIKQLRIGGKTHKSLDYILKTYPEADFYNSDGIRIDPFKYLKNELPVFSNFYYVLSRLNT